MYAAAFHGDRVSPGAALRAHTKWHTASEAQPWGPLKVVQPNEKKNYVTMKEGL